MGSEMCIRDRCERAELIELQAQTMAQAHIDASSPWLKRLGEEPADDVARQSWVREVATVAAYRDRYGINTRSLLGDEPTNDAQRRDAGRAEQAVRRARAIASGDATDIDAPRRLWRNGASIV